MRHKKRSLIIRYCGYIDTITNIPELGIFTRKLLKEVYNVTFTRCTKSMIKVRKTKKMINRT